MQSERRTILGSVLVSTAFAIFVASSADAGVVSISRVTTLRVQGAAGADTYDQTDGVNTFGTFADSIEDSAGVGAALTRSTAQQFSITELGIPGVIGISVEGEATAQVGEIGGNAASGESLMTVRFQVVDSAEPYDVGGSLGGTLGGSSFARLVNDGTSATVFEGLVDQGAPEGGVQLDQEGLLQPGTYTLSFRAFATGTPSPESAFVNVSFGVGAPPNPIPLPPALWAGLAGLVASGTARFLHMRQSRRACAG